MHVVHAITQKSMFGTITAVCDCRTATSLLWEIFVGALVPLAFDAAMRRSHPSGPLEVNGNGQPRRLRVLFASMHFEIHSLCLFRLDQKFECCESYFTSYLNAYDEGIFGVS